MQKIFLKLSENKAYKIYENKPTLNLLLYGLWECIHGYRARDTIKILHTGSCIGNRFYTLTLSNNKKSVYVTYSKFDIQNGVTYNSRKHLNGYIHHEQGQAKLIISLENYTDLCNFWKKSTKISFPNYVVLQQNSLGDVSILMQETLSAQDIEDQESDHKKFLQYAQQYYAFQFQNFTIHNEILNAHDVVYYSWDNLNNPFFQIKKEDISRPKEVYFKIPINATDHLNFIPEVKDDGLVHLSNLDFGLWLQTAHTNICLGKLFEMNFVWICLDHIKKCLDNKCHISIDTAFHGDIGLEFNNYCYQEMVSSRPIYYLGYNWIAKDTIFAKYYNVLDSTITFLYNDDVGNIIFQVSTTYPGFFYYTDSKPTNSYLDWLPTYKIVYKAILHREIANMWHEQLQILDLKVKALSRFKD